MISLSEGDVVVSVKPEENANHDKLRLEEFKAKIFFIIAMKTTSAAVLAFMITSVMTGPLLDASRSFLLLLSLTAHCVLFLISFCNELKPKTNYICLGISTISLALIASSLSINEHSIYFGGRDIRWNPNDTVVIISTLSLTRWKAEAYGASTTVRRLTHILFLNRLITLLVSFIAGSSLGVPSIFQVFGQFSFMMMSFFVENMTEESDDLSADRCASQALFYFLLGLYSICGGCGFKFAFNSFKCLNLIKSYRNYDNSKLFVFGTNC